MQEDIPIFSMVSPSENIRTLILEKEKELHDINEYRIRTLEELLKEKEKTSNEWKNKFKSLKNDFQYNLKLIEDRDAELDRNDLNFSNLKSLLRDRESEISELKIRLADAENICKQEQLCSNDKESFYQKKIKELRENIDSNLRNFEDERKRQRESFEVMKRDIQKQIQEKEEEFADQQREITLAFEEVLKERDENENKMKNNLMEKIQEGEMREKHLLRELSHVKSRNEDLLSHIEKLQKTIQDTEKERKTSHWELEDVRQMRDAKIVQLEMEKNELQTIKQGLLDEYEGKMSELLQSLQAVERAFVQQKKHYEEEIGRILSMKEEEIKSITVRYEGKVEGLSTKLRGVEEQLEKEKSALKHSKWECEDHVQKNKNAVEALNFEFQETIDQRNHIISEIKEQLKDRDEEIQSLKEKVESCNRIVEETREKVSQQHLELTGSIEREETLKRELSQQKKALEMKLEQQQQELQLQSEKYMKDLQRTEYQLTLDKQAFEEKIVQLERDLKRFQDEARDESRESYKSHGYKGYSQEEYNSYRDPARDDIHSYRQHARNDMHSYREHARDDFNPYINQIDHTETRVSPNTNRHHSLRISPMFSGDLGPPSPVKGLPSFSNSPILPNTAREKNSVSSVSSRQHTSALEQENEKLRAVISQMRAEIEGIPKSVNSSINSSNRLNLQKQLTQQQEYSFLLQRRVEEFEKGVPSTHSFRASEHEELEMLRVHIHQLNHMLSTQRNREENTTEMPSKDTVSSIDNHEDPKELKRQLKETTEHLSRVMEEREKLMEVSNQLQSERDSNIEKKELINQLVEKTEKETSEKYEEKINEIEGSIKELKQHNRVLKKELKRWASFALGKEGPEGEVVQPEIEGLRSALKRDLIKSKLSRRMTTTSALSSSSNTPPSVKEIKKNSSMNRVVSQKEATIQSQPISNEENTDFRSSSSLMHSNRTAKSTAEPSIVEPSLNSNGNVSSSKLYSSQSSSPSDLLSHQQKQNSVDTNLKSPFSTALDTTTFNPLYSSTSSPPVEKTSLKTNISKLSRRATMSSAPQNSKKMEKNAMGNYAVSQGSSIQNDFLPSNSWQQNTTETPLLRAHLRNSSNDTGFLGEEDKNSEHLYQGEGIMEKDEDLQPIEEMEDEEHMPRRERTEEDDPLEDEVEPDKVKSKRQELSGVSAAARQKLEKVLRESLLMSGKQTSIQNVSSQEKHPTRKQTESQTKISNKLKVLQRRRSEMVTERNKALVEDNREYHQEADV